MAITGLHLILTYKCNFECDHCFIYCKPEAKGVMKISDLRQILTEAKKNGKIRSICFEGGEPFLYYQTMLWGLRVAKEFDFRRSIVTNAYWATSIEDAKEWLTPISEIGIHDLAISDDTYHYDKNEENLAKYAYKAAVELNLPVSKITIDDLNMIVDDTEWKGKPVVGGNVQFKGRAIEKLAQRLPVKPWTRYNKCLDEDFSNQGRVHIDPFGYVHVCQGITIGNMQQTPLNEILDSFDPEKHPVCGPILRGGPAELVREYNMEVVEGFVDECHLCYSARLKLRERFPNMLAPNQVYGL